MAGRGAPGHGDAVGTARRARRLGQQPVGIHEPERAELAAADSQHVALHSGAQPIKLQAVQPAQGVARTHELRTALTDGFLMVGDIPERRRRVDESWRVSGERRTGARDSEGEQRLGRRRQLHADRRDPWEHHDVSAAAVSASARARTPSSADESCRGVIVRTTA
eukprot:scaffold127459_cov75-Phaeocystis_antarctica.AAC.3